MRIYILTILWIFAIAISSCGVTNKLVDKYQEKVDSTFTQVKKEDNTLAKDSVQVNKTDNSTETVIIDSSSLKIDFEPTNSDSSAYTDVTIKKDTNGLITINTGGKKIKSITNTIKNIDIKIEAKKTQDSSHVLVATSAVKIDSTKSTLDKVINTLKTKKFSIAIPWYVYVIIIIAGFLIWFFWGQIISAKKIVSTIKLP